MLKNHPVCLVKVHPLDSKGLRVIETSGCVIQSILLYSSGRAKSPRRLYRFELYFVLVWFGFHFYALVHCVLVHTINQLCTLQMPNVHKLKAMHWLK